MISILYVDDEPDLLELCRIFLEKTGEFRVDTLTSGREVLSQLALSHYDAIISDYQMPDMDGISLLKSVRLNAGDIPFILFTGKGREEVVIEAVNNGADFYLQKGGDPKAQFAELIHKVRQAVSKKQAERSLHESEKRLSDIINFLPDAMFAIDAEGCVIAWNRAIEELTGVPAAEMLGRGDHEYAVPFYGIRRPMLIDLIFEPDERIKEHYYGIVREKDVLIAETDRSRPRDRQLTLMGKASPLYGQKGEIIGAIESLRDTTEKKRAEQAIARSQEYLNQIFSSVKAGIIIIDYGTHEIVDINSAGAAMIGLPKEQITGHICHTFVCPALAGKCPITDLNKSFDNSERILITGDGKKIPIIKYVTRMNLDGRECLLETFIDNSERKQAEEKLIRKTEDLHAAYEELSATEDELRQNYEELNKQEQDLHASEDRYRALYRDNPSMFFTLDSGGKVISVNEFGATQLGYTVSELEGQSVLKVFHEDDRDTVTGQLKICLKSPYQVFHWQFRKIRKDNSLLWVEEDARSVKGPDGSLNVLVVCQDITERKRTEDELRGAYEQITAAEEELRGQYEELVRNEQRLKESEERYRALYRDNPSMFFTLDSGGKIISVNEFGATQLGYTVPELEGQSVLKVFHEDDRDTVTGQLKICLKSPYQVFHWQFRKIRKDNSLLWVEEDARSVKGPDGSLNVLVVCQDITERKRAEDELRGAYEQITAAEETLRGQYEELVRNEQRLKESEERYRHLVESTSDWIWEVDRNGTYSYVSPNIVTLLGYEPSEVIGRTPFDFIVPAELERIIKVFNECVVSLRPIVRLENTNVHKDGHSVVLETSGEPVLDDAGNLLGYRGIDRDITERKRADTELRAAYEQVTIQDKELRRQYDELVRNEERLKESEEKYRTLVDHSQDGVFIVQDECLVFINRAFMVMTGYAEHELLGRPFAPLIAPEDRDVVISRHKDRMSGKEVPETYEFSVIHQDSRTRLRMKMNAGLGLYQGRPATIGTLHDVTMERQREEALRESEVKYRELAELLPQIVFEIDLDFHITYANRYAFTSLGYTPQEIEKGVYALLFFDPSQHTRLLENMQAHLKGEPVEHQEYTVLRKDGSTLPVLIYAAPVFKDQNISGLRGVIVDISERKKMEQELRESEEKYRSIIENMQDMFYRTDMQGKIVMVSPSAAPIAGYNSPQEMVGLDIAREIYADPKDREKFLADIAKQGSFSSYPLTFKSRDGALHYVTLSCHYYHNAQGQIAGIEGTVHDITHLKQVEHALREANRKLNLLNSITRHDVANQLTVIQGYTQLAMMKEPDPVIGDFLKKIETVTSTIAKQIAFTGTYQELGVHAPSWYCLEKVLVKVKPKDILFSSTCDDIEIFADPMLEKVFANLFDNAIRHGERVSRITVRCESYEEQLMITVEDNGVGIPLDKKQKVFQKGYGRHTGFGLFLAREILAITGITIHETGKHGSGARFEIIVPKSGFRPCSVHENSRKHPSV